MLCMQSCHRAFQICGCLLDSLFSQPYFNTLAMYVHCILLLDAAHIKQDHSSSACLLGRSSPGCMRWLTAFLGPRRAIIARDSGAGRLCAAVCERSASPVRTSKSLRLVVGPAGAMSDVLAAVPSCLPMGRICPGKGACNFHYACGQCPIMHVAMRRLA